jgi:hypothetical protein
MSRLARAPRFNPKIKVFMQHVGRIPSSSRNRRRLLEVLGLMPVTEAKRKEPASASCHAWRNDSDWFESAGATLGIAAGNGSPREELATLAEAVPAMESHKFCPVP